MANWPQLKTYINQTYPGRVSEDIGEGMSLLFDMGNGRTQMVFVSHHVLMDGSEDWVVIDSPVGQIGQVDVTAAVLAAGGMVCGGVSVMNDRYITLRHAVPLENLDVNEFERPFRLVTTSADRLEAMLTGRDEF